MRGPLSNKHGFTLIELSIVLVIIGLIVGGVLVGQDLIRAAAVRAQVSQIEKYNTASNTFREKYNCLPGDCSDAGNFGFTPRGPARAEGDGNGQIEGDWDGNGIPRMVIIAGEAAMFWTDLSKAGLIEDSFTTATCCTFPSLSYSGASITLSSTPSLYQYIPEAKVGQGNFIHVYSPILCCNWTNGGINYFGLLNIANVDSNGDLSTTPTLSLSVAQASAIDMKMDDGLPQSGNVTAQFVGGNTIEWASGTTASGVYGGSPGTSVIGSSLTCYDNGGNTANPMQYSMSQNRGAGANCALSFRFQ
jgi:prepilin-type N-terminal cleavage/methylation domain-containing protein